MLDYRVSKHHPKCREELINCIQEEWKKISIPLIKKFINNLKPFMKGVIKVNGDYITPEEKKRYKH